MDRARDHSFPTNHPSRLFRRNDSGIQLSYSSIVLIKYSIPSRMHSTFRRRWNLNPGRVLRQRHARRAPGKPEENSGKIRPRRARGPKLEFTPEKVTIIPIVSSGEFRRTQSHGIFRASLVRRRVQLRPGNNRPFRVNEIHRSLPEIRVGWKIPAATVILREQPGTKGELSSKRISRRLYVARLQTSGQDQRGIERSSRVRTLGIRREQRDARNIGRIFRRVGETGGNGRGSTEEETTGFYSLGTIRD